MDAARRSQAPAEPVRRRFAKYGVVGGVLVGVLLGVVYSGPHIRDWELGATLLVTLGFAVGGLLLGYIAEVAAKASMADGGTGGGFGGRHGVGSDAQDSSDDHGDSGGAGADGGGGGTAS
jgi:hypothetical protein